MTPDALHTAHTVPEDAGSVHGEHLEPGPGPRIDAVRGRSARRALRALLAASAAAAVVLGALAVAGCTTPPSVAQPANPLVPAGTASVTIDAANAKTLDTQQQVDQNIGP